MCCVCCFVVYYVNDFCLVVGLKIFVFNSIICFNYFIFRWGCWNYEYVNVSWCFVCLEGGSFLCCDFCFVVFYCECLNIDIFEGNWYCNDCKVGKKLYYREIVWVKVGWYRWWLVEICYFWVVFFNIDKMRYDVGEFFVFFFGFNDYLWIY